MKLCLVVNLITETCSSPSQRKPADIRAHHTFVSSVQQCGRRSAVTFHHWCDHADKLLPPLPQSHIVTQFYCHWLRKCRSFFYSRNVHYTNEYSKLVSCFSQTLSTSTKPLFGHPTACSARYSYSLYVSETNVQFYKYDWIMNERMQWFINLIKPFYSQ